MLTRVIESFLLISVGILNAGALISCTEDCQAEETGADVEAYQCIYASKNLAGMSTGLERNPGRGTSGEDAYLPLDGGYTTSLELGTISANPGNRLVYINTMVGPKFINSWPDGKPIDREVECIRFETRMPRLPTGNNIPQCFTFVMFLYDGNNVFGSGSHRNLEACAQWVLNPWDANKGKLFVLNRSGAWIDTGLSINPRSTDWHYIEFKADFNTEEYVSLTVDGKQVHLQGIPIYETMRNEWDGNTAAFCTLEVTNAWPGNPARYKYSWAQDFRDFSWDKTARVEDLFIAP